MKPYSSGIRHSPKCQCSRCLTKETSEPEIKYSSYRTRANIIAIESIEYNGTSWRVNYTVSPLYRHNNSDIVRYGSWTLDMWNKYSTRWHEGEGK